MNASRRTVASAVGMALLGALSIIAIRAARAEIKADFRPPRAPLALPTTGPLAGASDATFASDHGERLRGWWVPARNGAAIVFVHGTGSDRSQLLPQAEILARAGYGVLLFDLPGHGESSGRVTWSQTEPSALHDALSYTRAHGIDRVGVVGFSAGAMIALHEAMLDEDVDALVLEGAMETLDAVVLNDFRSLGPLTQWPAILGARWAGFRAERLGPWRALRCPVFFIAGREDRDVPLPLTLSLFERVNASKELWVIDSASHGTYQRAAGGAFDARLLGFFDKALHPTNGSLAPR